MNVGGLGAKKARRAKDLNGDYPEMHAGHGERKVRGKSAVGYRGAGSDQIHGGGPR